MFVGNKVASSIIAICLDIITELAAHFPTLVPIGRHNGVRRLDDSPLPPYSFSRHLKSLHPLTPDHGCVGNNISG